MTIKFLKPRKLGAASESWLKHDVRVFECTAATWRYLTGGVDSLEDLGAALPLLLELIGLYPSLLL